MTTYIKYFITPLLVLLTLTTRLADALGNGPWIAAYDHLITKAGFDFYHTAENFMNDGTRQSLSLGNQQTALTQDIFWLEGQYGIADHWEALLHLGFVHNEIDSYYNGTSLLAGNAIPELRAAVRWNLLPGQTPLTVEANVKVPFISMTPADPYSLVTGDGNVDVGFIVHLGHRIDHLYLSLSPGVLFRSSGYSQAATGNAAVEVRIRQGYLGVFSDFIYSFSTTPLLDSSVFVHDAPGTGGSYALLSGSPVGVSLGGKIGVRFPRNIVFEGRVSHAMAGMRFANYLDAGCTLSIPFNFYVPEKKIKIHEVPFDEETPKPDNQ